MTMRVAQPTPAGTSGRITVSEIVLRLRIGRIAV